MNTRLIILLAFCLLPTFAHAHTTEHTGSGLVSGLLHPVLGLDHLTAMVAVGLWGAQLGRPLVFALPVAFPMMMAVGGMMGLANMPIIAVELGIALSALILGLAIVLAFRAPIWLAVLIVSLFAIFHGYAHGQELPEAASPIAYGIGFMISTGLLHLAGIVIGLLHDRPAPGPIAVRGIGGAIAALGVYFVGASAGIV